MRSFSLQISPGHIISPQDAELHKTRHISSPTMTLLMLKKEDFNIIDSYLKLLPWKFGIHHCDTGGCVPQDQHKSRLY